MKVWTKLVLNEQNKDVDHIAKSLTHFLYKDGVINNIEKKYNISYEDKNKLDQYTANRIAGLLLLYLSKNTERINDIVNRYDISNDNIIITPELEGYIEK